MNSNPKPWHDEEMLGHMAFNLFQLESDLSTGEIGRAWDVLSDDERSQWKERAREKRDAFAAMTPRQKEASNRMAMHRILKKNDARFRSDPSAFVLPLLPDLSSSYCGAGTDCHCEGEDE